MSSLFEKRAVRVFEFVFVFLFLFVNVVVTVLVDAIGIDDGGLLTL